MIVKTSWTFVSSSTQHCMMLTPTWTYSVLHDPFSSGSVRVIVSNSILTCTRPQCCWWSRWLEAGGHLADGLAQRRDHQAAHRGRAGRAAEVRPVLRSARVALAAGKVANAIDLYISISTSLHLLKLQQTPKPLAQAPSAAPPLLEHSEPV